MIACLVEEGSTSKTKEKREREKAFYFTIFCFHLLVFAELRTKRARGHNRTNREVSLFNALLTNQVVHILYFAEIDAQFGMLLIYDPTQTAIPCKQDRLL